MSTWLIHCGLGLSVAVVVMAALWAVQRRTRNTGIVDVGWALGIGLLILLAMPISSGNAARRALIAVLVVSWALRLGLHLIARLRREPEDGRYQNLRRWAGQREQMVLFVFFMLQASWVVLFAMPAYVAAQNGRPLGLLDAVAVLLFGISVVGESLADRQLAQFRADPGNRGAVCRRGLWRYSRHPNYFFEWLHWLAYPLLAYGLGSAAWLTLLGPALMLLFLLKITGIPPTEARALQSRGERYRAYQSTTSAFFPWFPKESIP